MGQKFFGPIKFWIQKKMLHLKKIGPKILGPEWFGSKEVGSNKFFIKNFFFSKEKLGLKKYLVHKIKDQ